ncbi:hypothetical protein [Candidatus Methanoperedens nitratireducens]|uniref:Uncharacterized protein n=1 Tax=Candidatus Methanoperedens nitratireducens TaxID=1392998 RepID=A0A284VJ96_9EURY|nr:hypothetical protein [Candidatus Methanoperedens nitroreducens]SNQ59330.1 hypothetical protein MNV_1140026 [Candidatus Methanoperedens nitroreducens]
MQGWIIPPPKEPAKSKEEFREEREEKVRWLLDHGYLRSERIKDAMLRIPREDFIPFLYRDYAYLEVPLPLPGEKATPFHARIVTLSFMSPSVLIKVISSLRSVLGIRGWLPMTGYASQQHVLIYPL